MTRKSKPPIAIYSALADATRCRIVEILLAGPIPVHTLAGAFSISRPAISRHLRVLKTAGLVVEVKKGRENLYALRPAKLSAAVTWIGGIVSREAGEDRVPQPVSPPAPAPVDIPEPAPAEPAAIEPIVIELADVSADTKPASRPEKAQKPPRPARQEPTISQMGFDF